LQIKDHKGQQPLSFLLDRRLIGPYIYAEGAFGLDFARLEGWMHGRGGVGIEGVLEQPVPGILVKPGEKARGDGNKPSDPRDGLELLLHGVET